jgi:DNA-binding transcriptional MerR regulator
MDIYRSKDIQDKLGVSKIQLSHWINKGAIKPYREDFRRGGYHEFNRQNLIEAAICKELSDLQVPVKSMVDALEMMRKPGFEIIKIHNDTDWFLVFSTPYKYDYKNVPWFAKWIKVNPEKTDTSKFEGVYLPVLIPKENLLEEIEYMQSVVVLSLKHIFNLS